MVYRLIPGLKTISDSVMAHVSAPLAGPVVRGVFWVNGVLFSVIGDFILYASLSGSFGQFGPIANFNDGLPVTFAASRTQLVICSAGVPYLIDLSALSLTGAITWMSASVSAVAYCNTYFLFLATAGNGFFYSEPGDANTGSATNFAAEETHASRFIMLHVINNQPWLFGELAIQPFYQTQDTANPFLPNLSASMNLGSAAKFGSIDIQGAAYWLHQSKEGGISAYKSTGYSAQRISPTGVEHRWRASSATLARSWSVFWPGHLVWRIWLPDLNESWQYDIIEDDWTKIAHWNLSTGAFNPYLAACGAYDATSHIQYVGSINDGAVYIFDPSLATDLGEPIRWLRQAPSIANEHLLTKYPGFELIMNPGAGDGSVTAPGSDPTVSLRHSEDGGDNWSASLDRTMGQAGDTLKRLTWWRLGMARRRSIEVSGMAGRSITIHDAFLRNPQMVDA